MFNFPDSPTLGQQVTGANGVVYQWDGAKWAMVASTSYLPLAGGAMTGAMTLAANPAAPLQPATKQYVDALPVPVVATTTPLMNGAAAIGASGKWADGAHVHPTDTTLYPKTGGTIAGNVSATGGITSTGGSVVSQSAGTATALMQLVNSLATVSLYLDSTGTTRLYSDVGPTQIYLDPTGFIGTSNDFYAGSGYNAKAGRAGARISNVFNIDWVGSVAHLWVDTTNLGAIAFTSDYRIKKDVAPLGSTWERVKALKPITYTQAEYHPPGEVRHAGKDGEPMPMFAADDVERWGFIAHELQETLTQSAATGEKDSPTHIQSPNPWAMLATVTRALQEAIARIEALEMAGPASD